MKKLISVLLSLMLIISASAFLFSCGDEEENEGGNEKENQPCTEHVDSDENNICDNCKEILLNLPAGPVDVTVTFTVKDQDGVAVPSVTLIFTEKSDAASEPITATADASGKVTMTLKAVNYYVDCDYNVEEIGYYVLDTRSVNITESTAAMDILLTDGNIKRYIS